jgi:hypothetical protein
MDCHAARRTLLLDLYGEVAADQRGALEVHLGACDECRLAAAGERRLHGILGERVAEEPSDELLDRCRRDLSLALDAERRPLQSWAQRLTGFWVTARLSPAWGVALLVAGFLVGGATLRGDDRYAGRRDSRAPAAGGGTVSGAPLANLMALESAPDRDHVRLSYDTLQRGSLEGTADDPAIREFLVRTLRDNLNAGLRLEAIDALRRHTDERDVRSALLDTLRGDENTGARLKAIDALHDRVAADPEVRRGILDALESDTNAGVRVSAIDALSRARDPQILPAMERLSREAPDTYVRMRSGAFVDAMQARNPR